MTFGSDMLERLGIHICREPWDSRRSSGTNKLTWKAVLCAMAFAGVVNSAAAQAPKQKEEERNRTIEKICPSLSFSTYIEEAIKDKNNSLSSMMEFPVQIEIYKMTTKNITKSIVKNVREYVESIQFLKGEDEIIEPFLTYEDQIILFEQNGLDFIAHVASRDNRRNEIIKTIEQSIFFKKSADCWRIKRARFYY